MDRVTVDGHGQRQGIQPGPSAVRAWNLAHVALDLVPLRIALGILVPPPQVGHHTLEAGLVDTAATEAVPVADLHPVVQTAIQHQHLVLLGQATPWSFQVHALILDHCLDQAFEVPTPSAAPWGDRPFAQAQVGIRDHQLGVHLEHRTEAVAVRTGPVGAVEREVPGGKVLKGLPVTGPGQVLAKHNGAGLIYVASPH